MAGGGNREWQGLRLCLEMVTGIVTHRNTVPACPTEPLLLHICAGHHGLQPPEDNLLSLQMGKLRSKLQRMCPRLHS